MKSKHFLVVIYASVLLFAIYAGVNAGLRVSRPAVLLEWKTASELNTVGFNLYRSEVENGPFERLNAQFLPSSTDPLAGGSYRYTDTQVETGKMYFYRLEEVEADGKTTILGEIQGKAARHGLVELVAAVVLVIICSLGLRFSLRQPSRKMEKAQA